MHADQKIVVGPKVDKEDIEVSVTYHLNGYLIPVDENGNEIPNVGPYQFATDENDPTKIALNQIVPDIEGYTHAQEGRNSAGTADRRSGSLQQWTGDQL